jgi:hypothetical protein
VLGAFLKSTRNGRLSKLIVSAASPAKIAMEAFPLAGFDALSELLRLLQAERFIDEYTAVEQSSAVVPDSR